MKNPLAIGNIPRHLAEYRGIKVSTQIQNGRFFWKGSYFVFISNATSKHDNMKSTMQEHEM